MTDTYSHSEVDTYNKCERAWYYGYVKQIEPVQTKSVLSRGKLGHLYFETLCNHVMSTGDSSASGWEAANKLALESLKDTIVSNPSEYLEVGGTVVNLLANYLQNNPFLGWEILAVEQEYFIEVSPTVKVPVIVDLVGRDTQGNVTVVDHKFIYDFLSDTELDLLPQLPLYAGVMLSQRLPVKYAAYNQIRTRPIKNPTYEQAYRFDYVPLTETRLRRTFVEHNMVAAKVAQLKYTQTKEKLAESTIRAKNPIVCRSCFFSEICVAELNGNQPELVQATYYRPRARRSFNDK